MNTKNSIINLSLIFLIILTIFSIWYKEKYSMGIVESYTINAIDSDDSVLIATQGSEFKDELTLKLIEHLGSTNTFIKVVDVTNLMEEKVEGYDAVIIMHSWEMWSTPSEVRSFLNTVGEKDKIYCIGTSGSGDLELEGVDGISSASEIINIDYILKKTLLWLESIQSKDKS